MTAPERIWAVGLWDNEPGNWTGGHWDLHQDFSGDVEYVRADIADALAAKVGRLTEARFRVAEALDHLQEMAMRGEPHNRIALAIQDARAANASLARLEAREVRTERPAGLAEVRETVAELNRLATKLARLEGALTQILDAIELRRKFAAVDLSLVKQAERARAALEST